MAASPATLLDKVRQIQAELALDGALLPGARRGLEAKLAAEGFDLLRKGASRCEAEQSAGRLHRLPCAARHAVSHVLITPSHTP